MRMLSKSVRCPRCGQTAVITLSEEIDPEQGTEGHRIVFECRDSTHQLDERAMVKLWADDQVQG